MTAHRTDGERLASLETSMDFVQGSLKRGEKEFEKINHKLDRMNGAIPGMKQTLDLIKDSIPNPQTCVDHEVAIKSNKTAIKWHTWAIGIMFPIGGGIIFLLLRYAFAR